MDNKASNLLALDVGAARVGLALASWAARLPTPLPALPNDAGLMASLREIIERQQVGQLVVGLPRGLDGQESQQTAAARQFASHIKAELGLPVSLQDEAVTSKQAEAELKTRKKAYTKGDIDSLSAVYILEDYLRQQETENG